MDNPAAVARLAILDAIPIADALARCDTRFASAWCHWVFFAQADKPERALLADPDARYGGSPEGMGAEACAAHRHRMIAGRAATEPSRNGPTLRDMVCAD